MKPADFYQGTADAMGVALYLYPDGSVTNSRKAGIEPTAMIEPHDHLLPRSRGRPVACANPSTTVSVIDVLYDGVVAQSGIAQPGGKALVR